MAQESNTQEQIPEEFYSCKPIRRGFNYYRSGKVTACCFSLAPELQIGNINDPNLAQKILDFQNNLIRLHKEGKAPKTCRNCANFVQRNWRPSIIAPFNTLTLNHYKACNLKCAHCGYRNNDDNERDTPHEQVLESIKQCIDSGLCNQKLHLEVGGGEPSISAGVHEILAYALVNNWTADINSNGAKFSPLFAQGVNQRNFRLLLTPDAGTREVYAQIKGVDNFENTWANIKKYMIETNGKALVKFILEAGNKDDVAAMIQTASENNVKTCVLCFDMNIAKAQYALYKEPVREFLALAKAKGLHVIRGAFLPMELIDA